MRKLLSLMLPLLIAVVAAAPVWAESKEGAETPAETLAAAALTEEGWDLLGAPGRERPFYAEPACDAPEMARDRFRRAVELDPQNAAAWRGWGRAERNLGLCPTGYGRLMTWTQMEGLDYLDFSEIETRPFERSAGIYAAVLEAEPKFQRAAELAPGDPDALTDLGENQLAQLWWEKDAAVRLRLADAALANFERAWRELAATAPDPWSLWDQPLLPVIAREADPVIWQRLLAGLLRLYDQEGERPAPEGAALNPGDWPEQARERAVHQLLSIGQDPPQRLDRDKALAILSAAHLRTVRLTAPKPEPAEASAGHYVAVGEAQEPPADSSVVVIKKSGQVDPAQAERQRQRLGWWGLMGQVELRQAALEAGFPQWQALVESAGRHYWTMINGLRDLYSAGDQARQPGDWTWHFLAVNEWLAEAEREPREDRRLIMALGALDILEDLVKLREARPRPEGAEPAGETGALSREYLYMLKIAGVMPAGETREALLARAERGFAELAAAEAPKVGGYYTSPKFIWAEGLIELSRREPDFQRFKSLADQAGELLRQALDDAAPGLDEDRLFYSRPAMAYSSWLAEEKNPERRRHLLENGLAAFEDAVRARPDPMVSGPAGALYRKMTGDMYFQLSELSAGDEGQRQAWFRRAVHNYQLAAEYRRAERGQPWVTNDALFRLGQIYAHAYAARTSSARDLLAAVDAWRDYFSQLPARAESRYLPGLRRVTSLGPETFQFDLTREIAGRMMSINAVLDTDRLNPWALTVLAGLYRELAVSAVLTPEYQRLYLGRAEKLLRQAVERADQTVAQAVPVPQPDPVAGGIPNGGFELGRADQALPESVAGNIPDAEYELGAANKQFRRPEADRRMDGSILALAKAELGLVLSEWTLLGGPCGEGGRLCLEEADQLWREAEALEPGSSRYARARWAAWLGDEESVKTLIRHTRDESGRRLFPTLTEAVQDPAFDNVKDQAWFKKQWYGFVR